MICGLGLKEILSSLMHSFQRNPGFLTSHQLKKEHGEIEEYIAFLGISLSLISTTENIIT
jgi:hypothetical protein